MATRREVLQAGLAASLLPAGGLAAFLGSSSAGAALLELECFVCDRRYADSMVAAGSATRHGFAVHVISGDVTDLWYRRLDAVWRRGPVPVAGVTGEDALFVLERLGWDRGLRVVYRGRHEQAAAGGIERGRLPGPEEDLLSRLAAAGLGARTDRAAEALAHSRLRAGEPQDTGAPPSVANDVAGAAALTAWLLAPMPGAKARS